jgi:lambda family phage portal protein
MRYRIKDTKVYIQANANLAGSLVLPQGYASQEASSMSQRVANWRPSNSGPNTIAAAAMPTARARSREAVRNNDLANSILEILSTDIIAGGIKPQFSSPDDDFNKLLAEKFLVWTDEADADGMLDYYGQQVLAVRSALEGGEVFGRFRPRFAQDGLSVPLQIQLLEAEFCPVELTRTGPTLNSYIQSGIEFNAFAKRVAYWMYRQHPYDFGSNPSGVGQPVQIPASEVMQVMFIKRPGLVRGMPWLIRILNKLHDLDEYDDGQLIRQKLAALFAAFVETGTGEAGIEDLFEEQTVADSTGLSFAYVEPGTVQALKPGQKLNWNEPPSPGDSYEVFVKHQERRVASGGGVIYETLSGDYTGITDRTWRSATTNYRRRCEYIQDVFIFQYCRPVVRRWLRTLELGGLVQFPRGITAATMPFNHLRPPWPYINPVQDIEATNFEIRSGLTARELEVSARGGDVQAIDDANERDAARVDAKNLVYDSDPRRMTRAGVSVNAPTRGAGAPGAADAGGGGGGGNVVPFKRAAADVSDLLEEFRALGDKLDRLGLGDKIDRLLSYSPDQPRVPAGNPDGGQFGSGGGGSGGSGSKDAGTGGKRSGPKAPSGSTPSMPKVSFKQLDPKTSTDDAKRFIAARNESSRSKFMSPLEPNDLKDHKLYLSEDGKTGYALSPDGDLQNLFSTSTVKGSGKAALVDAVHNGAQTLDCYQGYLTQLYTDYGFKAQSRIEFNPEFAPDGWQTDRDLSKKPDVVFMKFEGGDRGKIEEKAGSFGEYRNESVKLFPDYDSAKAAQGGAGLDRQSDTGGAGGDRKLPGEAGRGPVREGVEGPPGSEPGGKGLLGSPASNLLASKGRTPTVEEFHASLTPHEQELIGKASAEVEKLVPTTASTDAGGYIRPDGTYTPERAAVHEQIIKDILSPEAVARATPAPGEAPTLTVLGGRGGSGKSWLFGDQGPVDASKAVYLNSDDIKAALPGYRGVNAAQVHEESSDIAAQVENIAQRLKVNVVYDATLRNTESAQERINNFKASGYKVDGYYMFASPQTAAKRAVGRFMSRGRFVPPEVILNSTTNEKSFDKLIPQFSNWGVYDNDGAAPKFVAGSKP